MDNLNLMPNNFRLQIGNETLGPKYPPIAPATGIPGLPPAALGIADILNIPDVAARQPILARSAEMAVDPLASDPSAPPVPQLSNIADLLAAIDKAQKAKQTSMDELSAIQAPKYDASIDKKALPWLAGISLLAQALAGNSSNVGSQILGGFMAGNKIRKDAEFQSQQADYERKRALAIEKARMAGENVDDATKMYQIMSGEQYKIDQATRSQIDKAWLNYQNFPSDANYQRLRSLDKANAPDDASHAAARRDYAAKNAYWLKTSPEMRREFAELFGLDPDAAAAPTSAETKDAAQTGLINAQAKRITTLTPLEAQKILGETGLTQKRTAHLSKIIEWMDKENAAKVAKDMKAIEMMEDAKARGWAGIDKAGQRIDLAEREFQWKKLHDEFTAGMTGYDQEEKRLNAIKADAKAKADKYKLILAYRKDAAGNDLPESLIAEYRAQLSEAQAAIQDVDTALKNVQLGRASYKQMLADSRPPSSPKNQPGTLRTSSGASVTFRLR